METGKVVVFINPKYFRPAEVELLLEDCSHTEEKLKWKREVSFKQVFNSNKRLEKVACFFMQRKYAAREVHGAHSE